MLTHIHHTLCDYGIELIIQAKPIKNINFRQKIHRLYVSHPLHIRDDDLAKILNERLTTFIQNEQTLITRHQTALPITLWGELIDASQHQLTKDISSDNSHILLLYRQALQARLPMLVNKWQPIVGQYTQEVHLKKMHTRWGSCNTRTKRIWLSVYLAAYPYECTEYVFVHELCHLKHANHSPAFWASVQAAMPDYQIWHDYLKHSTINPYLKD